MNPRSFRVLLLGGYGNFGAVIAERIAGIAGVAVIIAGRDAAKAEALARRLGAQAVRIDIDDQGLTNRLRNLGCKLVISTAGPFQGKAYRVPEAAIAAGAHYIDLADARDYVCGIAALDASARTNDVLVVSGASSVPALSSAVIDHYLPEFLELRDIHFGISASEKIPGVATVAAVLSYCGKPIAQWRDGKPGRAYGWQGLSRHAFAAPLGSRWLAHCDIPDLELFPARYANLRSLSFQAGLGLAPLQFGTWVLSWLTRARLIGGVAAAAPMLRRLAMMMEPFGDGRSGMFVELTGISHDGKPYRRNWELIAGKNHGPNIPCMAAVALTRKLAAGSLHVRGAMPCVGLITLEEYLAEFAALDIRVSERTKASNETALA